MSWPISRPTSRPTSMAPARVVERLERRVAGLLGKERAVFVPKGVIAQQAALRVWSERANRLALVVHPKSHLDLDEEAAYERLHPFRPIRRGADHAPLTLCGPADVREPVIRAHRRAAAAARRLPPAGLGRARPACSLGQGARGCLPPRWRPAVGGAAVLRPRTRRDHVARRSVYVSFYKGLGGLAGCALAGPADFVEETAVWRTRHGANTVPGLPLRAGRPRGPRPPPTQDGRLRGTGARDRACPGERRGDHADAAAAAYQRLLRCTIRGDAADGSSANGRMVIAAACGRVLMARPPLAYCEGTAPVATAAPKRHAPCQPAGQWRCSDHGAAAPASGRVVAVLGPTNTGKTHFAVERMLAHHSGMIGFPLRLLAREIYDRIVAVRGAAACALITGEEKLGREDARYLVCTVEAMPVEREVAFLGVDEIQLCADQERGHVFTDRLLHARGTGETMFLGSDTIRPILKRLVPEAEIITRPRFSILSFAGETKLNRLPRRSAVVAFTAAEVYALAEVIRRQKGGAAVVLGALSPRTRNAQVAMYQAGEVEHLVATDAIGMGLNMDVAHVAFASLRKFDGREQRRLRAPELGQIAGRAGRHMANGTFGGTNGCEPFDEREVAAIEGHSFPPLQAASLAQQRARSSGASRRWRRASTRRPPLEGLLRVRDALDHRSLVLLLRDEGIRAAATGRERVRLLWQVCQIPDFRKTLTDAHLHLLGTVYRHLTGAEGGAAERLGGQDDRPAGADRRRHRRARRPDRACAHLDLHVAPGGLAGRRRALAGAGAGGRGSAFRRAARSADPALRRPAYLRPDALLARRGRAGRTGRGRRRGRGRRSRRRPDRRAGAQHRRVGPRSRPPPAGGGRPPRRRCRSCAGVPAIWSRTATRRSPSMPTTALSGGVRSSGGCGRERPSWRRGSSSSAARAWKTALQHAVRRRLERWVESWIDRRLGPLMALARAAREPGLGGPGRGIAFRLVEHLGSLRRDEAGSLVEALGEGDRRALTRLGVRFGVIHLFVPELLRPAANEARGAAAARASAAAPIDPAAARADGAAARTVGRAGRRGGGGVRPLRGLRPARRRRSSGLRRGCAGWRGPRRRFEVPPELAAEAGLTRAELARSGRVARLSAGARGGRRPASRGPTPSATPAAAGPRRGAPPSAGRPAELAVRGAGAAQGGALTDEPGLRLDKWLWHARFIRHRELAADLVAARRLRLNEQVVTKTHQLVRPGDVLTLTEAVAAARACGCRRWASGAAPPPRPASSTRRSRGWTERRKRAQASDQELPPASFR